MSFVNALLYSITPILLAMVKPGEAFYKFFIVFIILILASLLNIIFHLDSSASFIVMGSIMQFIPIRGLNSILGIAYNILSVSLVIYLSVMLIRNFKDKKETSPYTKKITGESQINDKEGVKMKK